MARGPATRGPATRAGAAGLLALLHVAAAVAADGGPSCNYAAYPDVNFDGTDLPGQPASSTLSSADECAALCCAAAAGGCTAFTLNAGAAGARMCFLKSAAAPTPYPGGDSGLMNGTAPPVPPSCALIANGTPCAPAPWAPEWSLYRSTTCYADHETGYFVPPANASWGLVPVSWTNAQDVWRRPNPFDGQCEAAMLEGCRLVKAASPRTRCFRYNNMELAIPFLESNRAVMDAAHSAWFLQYIDPRTGLRNGTVFGESSVGAWFWNYSEPGVSDFVVRMVLNGTLAGGDAFDGTFTDDEIGFPVEHEDAPAAIGMSPAQVAAVRLAAQVASGEVVRALHDAGKYAYQAFYNGSYDGGNVGPAPTAETCAAFMRQYCGFGETVSLTMLLDDSALNQTLAAFLVVRGPIAYIGYGWASGQERWRPEFTWEVGEPLGSCSEPTPGVFTRPWTFGEASIDCNTWEGKVPAAAVGSRRARG